MKALLYLPDIGSYIMDLSIVGLLVKELVGKKVKTARLRLALFYLFFYSVL